MSQEEHRESMGVKEKMVLNWIWMVGAILALLTQFVMAVWYFAHMDSRIANLEYTQNHIIE